MPLDVDEAEDLVQPRDHRQLLGLDRLDPCPAHQLDDVVLDLTPVGLQPLLRIDLLGPEQVRDLDRLVPDLDIERIGQGVGGIRAHHQGSMAGLRRPDGGGGRDGRLADAALSGEQQDPHLTVAYRPPRPDVQRSISC